MGWDGRLQCPTARLNVVCLCDMPVCNARYSMWKIDRILGRLICTKYERGSEGYNKRKYEVKQVLDYEVLITLSLRIVRLDGGVRH